MNLTEDVKAQIIGGVLDLVLICPHCNQSQFRTVDYRIVDIIGIQCECGQSFNAKVQNIFDAAALSSQWVKIEANTPMPQIEDEDWYVTFENAARERYVTLAWYWISRKEWYVSDGDAQIAVPGKVVAFQPQNSPTPFQEETEDAN